MPHPFPPPKLKTFERFQPIKGTLITSKLWQLAHDYHRRRQNIHYQSISQPGIVCGLGVRPVSAIVSKKDLAEYKDGRWIQVQPGIAIDLEGNLIVVDQPRPYRISRELGAGTEALVYIVISYRDPDSIDRAQQNTIIQEFFRLETRVDPPSPHEVELCRIALKEPVKQITVPQNLFNPGANEIDLNYRIQAQPRAQAVVRVAQVLHGDPKYMRHYGGLLVLCQAMEGLCPTLKALQPLRTDNMVDQVTFSPGDFRDDFQNYDLLYLTGEQQALSVEGQVFEALKNYLLNKGGVLVVDAPANATALIKTTEILAEKLGMSLQTASKRSHPIFLQPFTFSALPIVKGREIQVAMSDGIILIQGDLASAWGPDQERKLTRSEIRTAQEFGVNLLHYAWRRRQLTGLTSEIYTEEW